MLHLHTCSSSFLSALLHSSLLSISFLLLTTLSTYAQKHPHTPTTTLTSAREIALYPNTDPKQQPAIDLQGVVTFVDTNTAFIQDETGSSFLHFPNPNKQIYQPQQLLHIKGIRHPGLIIGGILPKSIQIIGKAPLPTPRPITEAELASGRWHYHLVETNGIIRSFQSTSENSGSFTIHGPSGTMEVRLDSTPDSPHNLIDAHIHVTGIASGAINSQRQLVAPYIRLKDPSSMKILKPAPTNPFAITPTPIANLNGNLPHRVKITGTALSSPIANNVFLRDHTSTILIHTTTPPNIQPGDLIEAIGFVVVGPTAARLSNATCRIISPGEKPLPTTPTGSNPLSQHDGNLVNFNLEILQRIDAARNTQLICRKDNFTITILSRNPLPNSYTSGSSISATGILRVTKFIRRGHKAFASAADLLLRQDNEITLLSHPPKLTQKHLYLILGIVFTLTILSTSWAALLKRQVERQTKIIQQKIETEVIIEERHRIARDFHDTLEQELAGIALRLDAASERVYEEKALSLLTQLRKLLLRLQQETREFIWNLRENPTTTDTLPNTLRNLIQNLQTTTPIPIHFNDHSQNLNTQPLIQHQLHFIVREAIHNAIKYAKNATHIQLTLTNPNRQLTLTISDNGTGFDPNNIPPGHYGLQGMHERAKKINASLHIHSTPNQGTTITLTQPATPAA